MILDRDPFAREVSLLLKLSELALLGREVRQDDWTELGTPTPEAIVRTLEEGRTEDAKPSRLGPPYHFGATQTAHPWSWGRAGVPYYCVHCALNELLPMEWGGHPLWVTAYDDDAGKPCAWHFFKRAELIPDQVYERVGREKPDDGEGRY